MRVWVNLRQWVETESQSARIFVRLAETAQLHTDGKAGLYHDPDLQIALSWRGESQPTEAWGGRYHPEYDQAIRFLDESAEAKQRIEKEKEEARQRELEQAKRLARAEQERAEEQTRSAGKLKKLAAVVGLAAVLAMVATVFALNAREQAQQNAIEAETAKAEAEKNADEAKRLAKLAGDSKFRAEESLIDLAGRSVLNYSKQLQEGKDEVALAWLNDAAKSVKGISRAEKQLAGIINEHLKKTPLLVSRIKVNGLSWPRGDGYAVSRDGNWIAATSWAASNRDPVNHRGVTVQNINTLETQEIPVAMNIHSAALSTDGMYVAANSWRNGSEIWEVESGKPVGKPLKGTDDPTMGYFATSKDMHPTQPIIASTFFVISARTNTVVEVYNYKTDQTLVDRVPVSEDVGNLSQTFFTADGKHLVVVILKTLAIFSTKTWELVSQPVAFDSTYIVAREIPGQRKLLIRKSGPGKSGKDSTNPLVVVSLDGGKLSEVGLSNVGDVSGAEYSENGRFLALSRKGGGLDLHHGHSMEPYLKLFSANELFSLMSFSSSERYLALASQDNTIRILDMDNSGVEIHRFLVNNEVNFLKFIPGRDDRLYIGDKTGVANLYALKTGFIKESIAESGKLRQGAVDEWAYFASPNQQWLVASRLDGYSYLADLNNDQIKTKFNQLGQAKLVSWSADSSKAVLSDESGKIDVLSVDDGELIEISGKWIHVSLSNDGKRLATIATNNSLHIHSLASEQPTDVLELEYPARHLKWTEGGDLYYSNIIGEFARIATKPDLKKVKVVQLKYPVSTIHINSAKNRLILIGNDAAILLDSNTFSVISAQESKDRVIASKVSPEYSNLVLMTENQRGKFLLVIRLPEFGNPLEIPLEKSIKDFLINPGPNSIMVLNADGGFQQINLKTFGQLAVPISLKYAKDTRRLICGNRKQMVFEDSEGNLISLANHPLSKNEQFVLNYAAWAPGIEIAPDGDHVQSDATKVKKLQNKLLPEIHAAIQSAETEPLNHFKFQSNIELSLLTELRNELAQNEFNKAKDVASKLREEVVRSNDAQYVSRAILACAALDIPLQTLTNKAELLRSHGALNYTENTKFNFAQEVLGNGEVTYSVWYRPKFVGNIGTYQVVFTNEAKPNLGVSLFQQNNTPLQFKLGFMKIQFADSDGLEGKWTHIAITVSKRDRIVKCYLNGELVATKSVDESINISDHLAGDYAIGRSDLNNNPFKGDIARLSVWGKVLTSNEINADRNDGNSVSENLKICLVADSVTSGTLRDVSGGGRDVLIPRSTTFVPLPFTEHALLGAKDLGVRLSADVSSGKITMAMGFLLLESNGLDAAESLFMPVAKRFVNSPANYGELFGRSSFYGLELMGLGKIYGARKDTAREMECRTKFSIVSGGSQDSLDQALLKQAQSLYSKPLVVTRDEKSEPSQIDLRPFFNQRFGDDVTRYFGFSMNMRDNITGLKEGFNMINGVPTEISGAIQMRGFEPKYLNFPRTVKNIKVGRKLDRAVVLHTTIGVGPSVDRGDVVMKYHLVYEDGTRSSFPVLNDVHIGGWSGYGGGSNIISSQKPETLNIAKQISNESTVMGGVHRYLYHFKFINPNPSKTVATIDIESMSTTKAPYVLAITVE